MKWNEGDEGVIWNICEIYKDFHSPSQLVKQN